MASATRQHQKPYLLELSEEGPRPCEELEPGKGTCENVTPGSPPMAAFLRRNFFSLLRSYSPNQNEMEAGRLVQVRA